MQSVLHWHIFGGVPSSGSVVLIYIRQILREVFIQEVIKSPGSI